jgi:Flp pilus assembly protein TadG
MLNRKRCIKGDHRQQRGQALVEFSLGITFLLIMLAGVMDLGRAFFIYISMLDAAQEGASYGSISPLDVDGIRQRVRETSGGPIAFTSFPDDAIDIQTSGYTCVGDNLRVVVEYDFVFIAPFISGTTLPLSAEIEDTILQPPCP